MAESLVLVCDVCHEPGAKTVSFRLAGYDQKARSKDLCPKHLAELERGSRVPRRGRPVKRPTQARQVVHRKRRGASLDHPQDAPA